MRIRNNRRIKIEFSIFMGFIVSFVIIATVFNFIRDEPEQGISFWATMLLLLLMPVIMGVPYHILTAKEVVVEELGVAEYRKGKLKKLLKYEDIQTINVRKIDIFIYGTRKEDYPYEHITTLFGVIIRLLFSSNFRKRYDEDLITLKNHRKGFKEVELPFIIEIAKKSNCEVSFYDNYSTEENKSILNKALILNKKKLAMEVKEEFVSEELKQEAEEQVDS